MRWAGVCLATVLVALPMPAQPATEYRRQELVIPMRDGITLTAVALVPVTQKRPLPILLVRTPFGAAREIRDTSLPAQFRELAEDGYLFVVEDIRGRGGSGGSFVTMRAPDDPRNAPGTSEITDAWDTVAWLVKHLPSNSGKVGMLGTSYRGWLAAVAGVAPHPAVKAISPQAPMADTWLGDDFFQQGAFRQTQGALYAAFVEGGTGFEMPDADQFDFYLRLQTLDSIARFTGVSGQPSWRAFREHPARDAYWDGIALPRVLRRAAVPMLFVGGFYDEEDILGAPLGYRSAERADPRRWNRLVLGPWSHNMWIRPGGDSLGALKFGSATADHFRQRIQRPWFAHYLHGRGRADFPEVWAFEGGSNTWRTFGAWPVREARSRSLYLHPDGVLAFAPPRAHAPGDSSRLFDAWRADPHNPVPNLPRPDDGSGASTWLVQDQRFLGERSDVRRWTSAPLSSDLTVAGDVIAHLFASTTGTDADWVVKLIDVWPDSNGDERMRGYQLMINAGIMRGRYWRGFDRATPIPSGVVTPFTVDLHQHLYRIRKGHRLMVQVQSSWFPLYDRNPQRFVPNIFEAKATDFTAQEHRVWFSPQYPSHLTLPVLPEAVSR